jgi:hypothetical protein
MINWELKKRISVVWGSQVNFSKMTGDSEAKISRVLRGHKTLSEKEKEQWAKFLKSDSKQLFGT